MTTLLRASWRMRPLLLCHLFAALLLASWVWEPTRLLWDHFDDQLFRLLNTPLADGGWRAKTWAIGSLRPMDVAAGLIMLSFLLHRGWVFPGNEVRRALFAFVAILLLLLLVRTGFTALAKLLDWQHASPSLVIDGAVRLSELFPDWDRWELKDASERSFPGDHASVLLLWALFLSFFARGWRLLVIWGLATLFMLPRLVAGAHWGSDDFVGGLFLSLLAIAWGCCTPYASHFSHALERLTAPLFALLARLPMIGRMALVRGD